MTSPHEYRNQPHTTCSPTTQATAGIGFVLLLAFIIVFALSALTGCGTIMGFGEDISSAARFTQKMFSSNESIDTAADGAVLKQPR